MESAKENEKYMFRALIATDIHLGFAEKDALRGNQILKIRLNTEFSIFNAGDDTFNTFEEVLKIAVENCVDFVILGGDLFHENKPSSKSMTRCMELLRKYCTGKKAVEFAVVSDQKENFSHTELFPFVNYEDSNINISIPVFSIHGNHDDPIGKDHLCALDAISASGLVNYFGKSSNVNEITVSPILLKKGNNKLALYGLGYLPDERLHRLMADKKVSFQPPENQNDWFNVFVVHQNRVKHGTKYLPESFLTSLADLVIWGHEHESIVNLEWNEQQRFFVYQPGSTVVTSFCAAEAKPKHVGLLSVFHNGVENVFKVRPIPLKTTRKLYFESLNIEEEFLQLNIKANADSMFKYCVDRVEDILHKAAVEHSGDVREPKEPLIRLRVEYSDELMTFSHYQFSQQFVKRVANPKEIILFKSKRSRGSKANTHTDYDKLDELMDVDETVRYNIEDVIKDYFGKVNRKGQLNILCENLLTQSVKLLVEKDASADVISQIVDKRYNDTIKALQSFSVDCENTDAVKNACFEIKENQTKDTNINVAHLLTKVSVATENIDIQVDSDEESVDSVNAVNQTRKRVTRTRDGSGAKRARGSSSRGRGKRGVSYNPL
ncbi:double-strand break repair protein MRE11A-like isoform X2 [Leptotrombidium deliense]|uniref:Double-strand break repair protein n=1 Tax=Leptotrombidium deliense TaxID=299467 RepID=A0A443SR32_9ACAR|nr:double-strand break repair protein MRE11A-like isoform X2 [Leptotrombidium deliense]